ncbi:hypothetical protein P43SY_002324 [Pythium insidiosum]|uniref:WD repeat-containing protein 76 n=1 Tax=Pythium insidiosum TaxID=114742 RepID=A0AAD5MIV0_PYTIN|nr:hypothetical protein P43SY_002324 [Pythium insidiosum]
MRRTRAQARETEAPAASAEPPSSSPPPRRSSRRASASAPAGNDAKQQQRAPTTKSKPAAKPKSKPESKPKPKPESKPVTQAESKPVTMAESKPDAMAEYERKRLENIQRNLEFMRSLGVSTAKIAARTAAGAKPTTTAAARGVSAKRKPKEPLGPVRKSRRLEGKGAEELMLRDDKTALSVEEYREREPSRFDAHMDASAVNVEGDAGRRLLASLAQEDEQEREPAVDSSGVELVEYSLAERDIVNVTQERVYTMTFHPRRDRVVVASGDKRGNLSLWSADAPADDNDVVVMYRPHTLPVTALHFHREQTAKLLSASFDGTVREFDLTAAKFTELFAVESDTGITSMSPVAPDVYLLSCDDGVVCQLDRRAAGKQKAVSFELHEKKINTVHAHPNAEHCFATASLDRTVSLWDIRKLSRSKNAPLVTMPHTRSVNCAYFSPTGEHLVTVCQDDYNRVFETANLAKLPTTPTQRIPHNNQTGRWLTKLHAAWDPKRPSQYVVGCMQQPRRVQIFDATRKAPIQELTSDWFASVHSINVFHPSLNVIAGGNSSGRACLWRPKSAP